MGSKMGLPGNGRVSGKAPFGNGLRRGGPLLQSVTMQGCGLLPESINESAYALPVDGRGRVNHMAVFAA